MTARVDPGTAYTDACIVSPEAAYRGVENHLYRVEVHHGSSAASGATFKWSRDNGSVAARWLGTERTPGGTEALDLVVSSVRNFSAGGWVELSDDSHDHSGEPGLLVKVVKVQGDRLSVDPKTVPAGRSLALTDDMHNAKARSWNQAERDDIMLDEGAVPIVEASATETRWIDIEDGIQVQFSAGGSYRSGDYWLIPARVATGSIDWPHSLAADGSLQWQAQPPGGVQHYYAPLGFLGLNANNTLTTTRCLCEIESINTCGPMARHRVGPATPAPKSPKPKPPAPGPHK